MNIEKILDNLLAKKVIDKDRYIFVVPYKLYEDCRYVFYWDSRVDHFHYFSEVRMVWSEEVKKIKLITKKWHNRRYNIS